VTSSAKIPEAGVADKSAGRSAEGSADSSDGGVHKEDHVVRTCSRLDDMAEGQFIKPKKEELGVL
jgi:hypothetical protein